MSFARTKIQPPQPRATFVPRRMLQHRLADALQRRRVVLLCAPAGFGKTSALAHEVERLPPGQALAWVSADHGDDLHRLLECMLTALEPYDPPWRTAPEALVARASEATPEASGSIAAEIINTLDACDVPHGLIVFEDVQRIDDAAFFAFLDLLIERLGARWTIAMTTREDPSLALARLRATDELAEFRQSQLQFNRDEARLLAAGAGLDEATADALFERTQGWPAGLRLAISAASSAQGSGRDIAGAAALHVDRPLIDYLVTEVLERLRPELRDFLTQVSVLPELEPGRCARVTGNPRAAKLLDEIERLGLFVDVLDVQSAPASVVRSLRLHDLFRDALQLRLRQLEPERLASLRRRVAETEPDSIRRITLLVDAGQIDAAAHLAFEQLPQMIVTSGAISALHIVSQFPAGAREEWPELAFVRGLSHWGREWDFHAMLVQMERAARGFAVRGDANASALAQAYMATAQIALGRLDEAQALLDDLATKPLSTAARAIWLNAQAWLAIDRADNAAVAPLVNQLLNLLQEANRLDLWYHTTPPLRLPGLPGITPVLERHAELMLQVCGEAPTPLRAIAVLTQAWCAFWHGHIDAARRLVAGAQDDAHWSGQTGAVRAHLLTLSSVLAVVSGDRDGALTAAGARLQAYAGAGPWHRYVLAVYVARIAAGCDDLGALRSALQRLERARTLLGVLDVPAITQPREQPLAAQLAWLEGRAAEAIAIWKEALRDESAIDVMGQAPEVRVRLARALLRDRQRGAAREVLMPVFDRARIDGPGGALLAPAALQELAEQMQSELTPEQIEQLRAWSSAVAAHDGAPAVEPTARDPELAPGLLPLTAREREVLARIAAGDSNKLIARSFDLSLHTVKRHVANILGKIGADSRGQAAAWYRKHAG